MSATRFSNVLPLRVSRLLSARSGEASLGNKARLGSEATPDGEQLQRRVDFAKWCVTREDFRQLRRMVVEAIKDGRIHPTQMDPFNTQDRTVGPCVHTVNNQFIKPVTAEAGNMSWALMLHPEGLDCDLFITHAWQEGIFELIAKVLNSWPRGARHAYCCVLSNPQNLGISDLIANPRTSPFAKALHAVWAALFARSSRYQTPVHPQSIGLQITSVAFL